MRRPIAPIACILALITGAWFGQAYAFFAPTEPVPIDDPAAKSAVSAVWRFYDAIDTLLRTADDAALRDVVAPDYVDHVDEPGSPSNRDGLVRYLTSLRETHPALRLSPQDVVAQGDRVVARLAPTDAASGAILGIPLAGKAPWPHVDMLRVHDGRIAERWGDPTGYAPATGLFSDTLTFPYPGEFLPSLWRVTIAPGAGEAFAVNGPAIVSVESGELDIAANVEPPSSLLAPGSVPPKTLVAGEVVPVADGGAVSVANLAAAPAVFLALTLAQPDPDHARSGADDLSAGNEGIVVQRLAGNTIATENPGRLSIALARVALAPGARLADHPVDGLEMVVVDTGTVSATIAGRPATAWMRDPAGHSVAVKGTTPIAAGSSVSVARGATTSYANETTQPATLLVLTITPG